MSRNRFSMFHLCAVVLLSITWANAAQADYGLAMGGEAKYADGKHSFAYANPNAPKGGSLVMGSLGDFNTLNPYLLKGDKLPGLAELGDNFVFDTLMVESWDEPFAMYGLLASDIALAADKLSVTFTLNPKARFQNGDAVFTDLLNILITTLHGLHPATSLIDDVGSMNGTFTNIMRIVCLAHIVYAVSYNMQVRDATFAVGV